MKVAVGLSGGVDSAVSAYLLQSYGYDVLGVFFKLVGDESDTPSRCCEIERAREVAGLLGIPFHAIDVQEQFESEVVSAFLDSYRNGLTPNPCTICNEKIKFGISFDRVSQMFGVDTYFATGHYARIEKNNGLIRLKKGIDETKDQSYMLWRLRRDVLVRCIFPLGKLRKKEVLSIASKIGIVPGKESEDLCFISKNLKDFLSVHLGRRKGHIVTTDGRVIGEHDGAWFFTVGQRGGLGVSFGKPLYVISLDTKENTVIVGSKDDCMFDGCEVIDTNIIEEWDGSPIMLRGKVRYRSPEKECIAERIGEKMVVRFKEPQFAVTPGQSLVLYSDDTVFGGGVISKALKSGGYA